MEIIDNESGHSNVDTKASPFYEIKQKSRWSVDCDVGGGRLKSDLVEFLLLLYFYSG